MSEPVRIGEAELWLGRCEDVLPVIGRVPAIVVDPPYGIGAGHDGHVHGGTASPKWCGAIRRDYGAQSWDDQPLDDSTIALFRFSSRWQIIFGGNFYDLPPASCWLVWDKETNGNLADCELAWTNLTKAVRRIRHLWNGFAQKGGTIERVHPTQKPVGVMRWCIGHLPADVETVCDPCMGSGTTGVAAVQLGKRFIGIEQDAKHFAIACRRIEEAYRQGDMFIQRPPAPKQEAMPL